MQLVPSLGPGSSPHSQMLLTAVLSVIPFGVWCLSAITHLELT